MDRRGTARVVLSSFVVAACAAHPPPKPVEEEPFVLTPGPPLGPPLAPSFASAGGSSFGQGGHALTPGKTAIQRVGFAQRAPIVVGRIGGQATQLLVDTGASEHVLEDWFARQLAFASPTGRHAVALDSSSRRVGMDRLGKVTLELDGWGEIGTVAPLATTDSASGLRMLGIGGLLSPQELVKDQSVIIDFPGSSLYAVDDQQATARMAAMPRSLGLASGCGGTYALTATIEGQDARLVVDTGASSTALQSASAPGRALSGRSSVGRDVIGVGGPIQTRVLRDASVKVASYSQKLDVDIVATRLRRLTCPSDGFLGMDVLASCVLVINARAMQIGCN
jgi:predicted aspartyl protease